MPKITADMGRLSVDGARFDPLGPINLTHLGRRWYGSDEGARAAPDTSRRGQYSARIIVKLRGSDALCRTREDLLAIVRRALSAHELPVADSWVSQEGRFRDLEGAAEDEPGVQVVILDENGRTRRAFDRAMLALAETVCAEMRQESVVLDVQHRGRSVDLSIVTP